MSGMLGAAELCKPCQQLETDAKKGIKFRKQRESADGVGIRTAPCAQAAANTSAPKYTRPRSKAVVTKLRTPADGTLLNS